MAWKRDDWNDIIQRVNALNDGGCAGGSMIDEVDENHIWTSDDVQEVRDKLSAMCSNGPSFSAELTKWTQEIIDELNDAIDNCQCCDAAADHNVVYGPISLTGMPYGADHWTMYYFDPAGLQFGADNVLARDVDIYAVGVQWSGWVYPKCVGIQDAVLDCEGYILPETWYPPQGSGDTSIAPQLAAQGLIPVVDVHDWLRNTTEWYQPPWTASMYAEVRIDATYANNLGWLRCVDDCNSADYHASIGGTLTGSCPLATYRPLVTANYPNRWWSSLSSLQASIDSYNNNHSPKLAIASVNPWTTYYPGYANSKRTKARADGCYFVSLAYV